jgi:hypothetical protein
MEQVMTALEQLQDAKDTPPAEQGKGGAGVGS